MTVVVVIVAMVIPAMSFAYGMEMSMRIVTETIIVNEVGMPVRMSANPDVEMVYTNRIADQPNVAWAEVKIGIAYDTDVFITIPYIIIGNHAHIHNYSRRRWRLRFNYDWRGGCNYYGFKGHTAIRFHHATRNEHQQSPRCQRP
jgi:hypothetical protein